MKRFNSFHPINVFTLEHDVWEYELHNHNFFELILIERGTGLHKLNDLSFPYAEGDIFLLTPDDSHEFEIATVTRFIFLKFTEQIFKDQLISNTQTSWDNIVKNVLHKIHNTPKSIITNDFDKRNLFALINVMLYEFKNQNNFFNSEVVLHTFGAIMMIVSRNLNQVKTYIKTYDKDSIKVNAILTYIRTHMFTTDKIDINTIASHFYMSPNYISIYIKNHTGISIQQHIIQAKIKFAENLLKQKKYTITEIAEKVGFSSTSHFSKIFKKYKGLSPSRF